MNMQEALEWAADYADRNKIFEPVTNSRGYADGWKPPTPAEKFKVIHDIAESACSDQAQVRVAGGIYTEQEWREVISEIHNIIPNIESSPSADRLTRLETKMHQIRSDRGR